MNTNNYRTDLAAENCDLYRESNGSEASGVIVKEIKEGEINITRVEVTNQTGSEALGKPVGMYVTIDIPQEIPDRSQNIESCAEVVKREIREILEINDGDLVMVVGLGNWNITPDSLGPRVSADIEVTRHMFELMPEYLQDGIRPVCALTPGVLGTTGIETAEIILGAIQHVRPKVVIAIDALAARKLNRVIKTIQISNTGISPGAGIGNNRNMLSEETLGVPVIALGVPTVVSATTLAQDIMRANGIKAKIPPEINEKLIVTPKEIDEAVCDVAEIISKGINRALHRDDVWGD
jgi:spore protease